MKPAAARGASRRKEPAAPAAGRATLPAFSRAAGALPVLVAAALVALLVTVPFDDKDFWQHLAVGRALWQLHAVPHTDVWTWPGFGSPYLLPSWLFRALLWPFWAAGHLAGMYAWLWLTTLAAFAVLWRTARRCGASGVAPLLMLVWCALLYRQRAQVRPDTLVAVLLALQMWVLEARRHGARVHAAWLVAIGWAWVNVHISYPLFFGVGAAYLIDALWRARRAHGAAAENPRTLALALFAALLAMLANPFGFEALRQPFDYALHWSKEPIYRGIWELRPIAWSANVRNGLVAFLVVATLLALARARRAGVDWAQTILVPALAWQMAGSQRFIGYFALVAAPFAARDLADLVRTVRWPAALRPVRVRAALAIVACVLAALPELLRPESPLGMRLDPAAYPIAACDWIEAHGVKGRAFNAYSQAGYLLWRFWPQRERLPFMDIHQTGTLRDRDLYARAWTDSSGWVALDAERHFDWALLPRKHGPTNHLLDDLDGDAHWALVFADDVAALYLRRDGALAALAAREAYLAVPGGDARLEPMAQAVEASAQARDFVRAELQRQIAASPVTGQAHSQLANLEALDERWESVLAQLALARSIDPYLPRLNERESLAREQRAHSPAARR